MGSLSKPRTARAKRNRDDGSALARNLEIRVRSLDRAQGDGSCREGPGSIVPGGARGPCRRRRTLTFAFISPKVGPPKERLSPHRREKRSAVGGHE
jgi:hypothetical protein